MGGLNLERLLFASEDAAAVSGDDILPIGLVRQDVLATDTSADGDYSFAKVNAKGEQYVIDVDGNALLGTIDADTGSMVALLTTIDVDTSAIAVSTASIDSEIQSLSHAEDAAHVSGDAGIMGLAVRNDTLAALVDTDGDYAPLQVNADGALYTSGVLDLSNLVADDAVDSENPLKIGYRSHDGVAALGALSAGGDKSNAISDLYRRLWITDAPNIGIAGAAVTIGLTEVAIAATELAGRTRLMIQNNGNQPIFVGPTGVTVSSGIEVSKNSTLSLEAGEALAFFAISGTAGQDIRVMELA